MSFGIIIRGKNNTPGPRKYTSKEITKYFGRNIEEHEYKGYNRALGCQVESKEHYFKLLEEGGYVPFDEGQKLAEKHQKDVRKDYNGLEEKTMKTISALKMTVGKDGKLSSLEGAKKACEDVGMNFNFYSKLPSHYEQKTKEGGIE